MNYGMKGIKQKKKLLNSAASKIGSKIGTTTFKIILILAVAIMAGGSGLAFGAVHGIIASAPDISTIDVSPDGFATKIYDSEGNEIQTLAGVEANRISVKIDQVPENLQHAFVAIEDERFYDHNGIDITGILRAAMVAVTRGSLSQGASTITQQLIKNNVFQAYNEDTMQKIKRKIQEQYLAIKLETVMDKPDILINYMNTINLGNGYYGVQAAANGYFGKDVSELSLSECAVIASITQNPSKLNPIKNPDYNKERQSYVLLNMYEQGYITKEEYDEALADDVYARLQGLDVETADNTYSYFVDTVIDVVIKDLMESKGYTESQASNLIYRGGLKINTTQSSSMQSIADSIINDENNYPKSSDFSITNYSLGIKDANGNVSYYSHYALLEFCQEITGNKSFKLTFNNKDKAQSYIDKYKESFTAEGGTVIQESINYTIEPQISFSIIDQSTGQVKVLIGGRGDKTGNRTLNRAVDSVRQPGSSIKPLVAYGPALDTGAITLATPLDDAPYYYPGTSILVTNYTDGSYEGLMTVRRALAKSQNIPAIKALASTSAQIGFDYLKEFGFSTLVAPKNAINGAHDVNFSIALGGFTKGVKNIDMAAAYAAVANKGEYIEPTYYTTVTDSDGNVILDKTQPKKNTVMKETSAWLLTNAMESVTSGGTGTSAHLSSQPTAGKTGTSQDDLDKWFCGYTPYYTGVIWVGYDDNSKNVKNATHLSIWKKIMEKCHDGLERGAFTKPEGIVEVSVCSQSGKLPVEGLCDCDPRGSQIITEYFTEDTAPTETCNVHVNVNICNDSGKIASSGCTNTSSKIYIKKAASTALDGEAAQYKTKDSEYVITDEELADLCTIKHNFKPNSSSTGSSHDNNTSSQDNTEEQTTKPNNRPNRPTQHSKE